MKPEELKEEEVVNEEAVVEETPVEEATESTEAQPSKREAYLAYLRENGINADDDEERAGYNMRVIGEHRAMKDEIEKMVAPLRGNEMAAKALSHLISGGNPIQFMVEVAGIDAVKAFIEDPEKSDLITKAHQTYLDKIAESDAFDKAYEENIQTSIEGLNTWAEGKDLDDDKKVQVLLFLDDIGNKSINGTYSDTDYDLAFKALNFDKAMEEKEMEKEVAVQEAEVAGANKAIEDKLAKRKTDEPLGGVNGGAPMPKKKVIIDIRGMAGQS